MCKLPLIIALLPAGLILYGCISPPPMVGQKNSQTPASSISEKSAATTAAASRMNGQTPQGTPANSQANAQAMQEIMEELRQLGTSIRPPKTN